MTMKYEVSAYLTLSELLSVNEYPITNNEILNSKHQIANLSLFACPSHRPSIIVGYDLVPLTFFFLKIVHDKFKRIINRAFIFPFVFRKKGLFYFLLILKRN